MMYEEILNAPLEDIFVTSLELQDEFYYSYTTVLEDKTYRITITFLSRPQEWFISVADEDDIPIISNRCLVPDFPIEFPAEAGLNGVLQLASLPKEGYADWDNLKYELTSSFDLQYVYLSQEE